VRFFTDYENWQTRYQNKAQYLEIKKALAPTVIDELEKLYSGIKDDIENIDIATPGTYVRYTDTWKGATSWMSTTKNFGKFVGKELPGLDLRKAELTGKEQQELARYNEVSAQIASSNVEAIWDARADQRPAQINKVEAVLQKGYGDKYDHSRFIAARREIGYELGEGNLDDAALSIRRRLKTSIKQQKPLEKRRHRQDFER
jgi:hypothetical protein